MTDHLEFDYPARPPSPTLGDRRVMAVITIIALHLVIYWVGTFTGLQSLLARLRLTPQGGSLVLIISLLSAWCSLTAMWCVHSRWPSHIKALVTFVAGILLWAVLIVVRRRASFASDESVGWAAAFATQGLLTIVGTLAVEHYRQPTATGRPPRFTIHFLLTWTTVIAIVLGGSRWIAELLGWTTAAFQWKYFLHLQVVAVLNFSLAIGLLSALQVWQRRRVRLFVAGLIAIGFMLVANMLLFAIFRDVGADMGGICWLFGGQTLFLLATLMPLQELQDFKLKPDGQGVFQPDSAIEVTTEASAANGQERPAKLTAAEQTPRRLDSGR